MQKNSRYFSIKHIIRVGHGYFAVTKYLCTFDVEGPFMWRHCGGNDVFKANETLYMSYSKTKSIGVFSGSHSCVDVQSWPVEIGWLGEGGERIKVVGKREDVCFKELIAR